MINYAFVTDRGLRREQNEDSIVVGNKVFNKTNAKGSGFSLKNSFKIAIFDGVGGAECGEIASGVCAHAFHQHCAPKNISERDHVYSLVEKLQDELISAQNARSDMMTTFVCAMCNGKSYIFANMGDSRAYLISEGQIKQYSYDDTLRNKLLREGRYTLQEMESMQITHVITKCLGTNDFNKRDTHSYLLPEVKKGSYFIVMSDGISDLIKEQELFTITTQEKTPKTIVNKIEKLVLERGAHDNYSIIVLKN